MHSILGSHFQTHQSVIVLKMSWRASGKQILGHFFGKFVTSGAVGCTFIWIYLFICMLLFVLWWNWPFSSCVHLKQHFCLVGFIMTYWTSMSETIKSNTLVSWRVKMRSLVCEKPCRGRLLFFVLFCFFCVCGSHSKLASCYCNRTSQFHPPLSNPETSLLPPRWAFLRKDTTKCFHLSFHQQCRRTLLIESRAATLLRCPWGAHKRSHHKEEITGTYKLL